MGFGAWDLGLAFGASHDIPKCRLKVLLRAI